MGRCDLGVVPMFPASGVAVPYKDGDYLAAGLPVINSLPGELQNLLATHRCGESYEAGSTDSLEDALRAYPQRPRSEPEAEKARARALFEAHFNRAKTYPAFAEWVVGVGGRSA